MKLTILEFSVLGTFFWGYSIAQNRVAPGVPPQHYQNFDPNQQQQQFQHVPQNQFQGQPQQHLPHQQQQFQPPPPGVPPKQFQQQQQHVPHQQHVPQGQPQHIPHQQIPVAQQPHLQQQHPPAQGGHGHGHAPSHGQGQPILDASNLSKEREHIQEHMTHGIDTSQMSEQELQFHYFKMHDADNNNKLDGCELVKSLIHWHDASNHDHRGGNPIPEAKIFSDQELINMIDPILQNDDKNGDGFIDYAEFSLAQASAQQRGKAT